MQKYQNATNASNGLDSQDALYRITINVGLLAVL